VWLRELDGELDRAEAIDRVGRTKVERLVRERGLVEDDVDWGETGLDVEARIAHL
jgi:hypothetical protein